MLKGRGRDPRDPRAPPPSAAHFMLRAGAPRPPAQAQRPLPKPEPDYEVVEFPSEQYVNAKLQPPPPPPPRPPTGHPAQAGASCGLCGGGGARVRCAECGRRALCASCDDMYHRHPKRRDHQRQALTPSQLAVDERPPLPPKATPPVPPPRRHKISASPKPMGTMPIQDQRRATLSHAAAVGLAPGSIRTSPVPPMMPTMQHPVHMHSKMATGSHLGSMPYLPTAVPHPGVLPPHVQPNANTLGHLNAGWNRPRGSHGSLQGFNMQQHMMANPETWENSDMVNPGMQSWSRPLRRGASVLELGGGINMGGAECGGCANAWRYGSCAALDQPWAPGWPAAPAPCCAPHTHHHAHHHAPQTPQPYRRADSRAVSRAASRTGSRAASPALSMRSRTSRRTKHRTPSPPALPSSDADSESESETDTRNRSHMTGKIDRVVNRRVESRPESRSDVRPSSRCGDASRPERAGSEAELGPPPAAPAAPWHCEHCTFLNEAGVRVCAVCCRTPTAVPPPATLPTQMERLSIARSPSPARNIQRFSEEKTERRKKERVSTGCGPSPPKEEKRTMPSRTIQRLETPTREQNGTERAQTPSIRHDMAIGPSPPRESPASKIVDNHLDVPHRVAKQEPKIESPARHSVSVGPSPPRENSTRPVEKSPNFQKKSAGTSPPPGRTGEGSTSVSSRTKVSSGTSPPPQSISTQTYEDPSTWERPASATRSRDRRRFRDDARRERSRSRHSLSSDTKESDRSVRTTGAWEWRSRDASPPPPRRRASHLDLRRLRRRDSLYGSEATSPERWSGGGRAASMEALAGGAREAERGLELARLLADAERLGYNAAEVQAALTQSPGAPLAWLQARWAGLAGAVRGAAQRLARRPPTEREARAALARHRGAVWPAVTDCVDAIRRQGAEPAALRGRVWGSPAGADDDAAPCTRGEDSSDEYARGPYPDEEWYASDEPDRWSPAPPRAPDAATVAVADAAADDVARKLRDLLLQAGIPALNENLLLKSLLTHSAPPNSSHLPEPMNEPAVDFIQSENDFIDAYNALTRASPLPVTKGFNDREQIVNGEKVPNGQRHLIETDVEPQKITPVIKINPSEPKNVDQNHNLINNISNENLTSDPPIVIPNKESSSVENVIPVNKTNKVEEHEETIQQSVDLLPQRVQKDIVLTLNTPKEQTGEKSNNLNEIVDSTQKLIQQMKDEINSDINSIDGRQSDSSHSDHDSSSHDEHESSYSETEGGSDHSSITSEESKDFSEQYSEHEGVESLEHRDVNRTSSEDNEQFEEALDHIENQAEDVKNINIDILNSIAHSLQQELTISIEKEKVEAESEAEDSPDNLFVAVNSFEEIYEELNTPVKPIRIIPQKIIVKTPIEPKVMLPKYTATEMSFKSVTPSQLIITDNRQQLHRADLDVVEVESASEKESSPEPLEVQELANTVISNQEKQTPETNTEAEGNTAEVITNEPNAAEANTIEANAAAANTTEANAAEANAVEINAAETNTTEVIAAVINAAKTKLDKVNTATTNTDEIHAPHTNTAKAETELNRVNYNDITNIASHVNAPASHIAIEPDNTTNNNNSRTNNNQELKIINGDIKRDTNITKSSASVKSNIPKPVRSPPKSKVEKAPKLIVSKVPVRKTSTKAYPAPAPPKSHFGNVQSGLVKQLQNKIFNNPVKIVTTEKESKQNAAIKDEPQPSTSQIAAASVTINKGASPQKTAPKNNYFRETCRTEDEWTDSDSDDQSQVVRTTEQKEHTPVEYSPPPPVTLRRVSGNVIDLATIQLPEGSPERQARMLLAGGATETWEQAQLAVQLVARGAAPPAALLAALECRDLDAALAYLHQDCELCASRLPEHEMVSMLRCTHRCCRECARLYFNVQITERSIADCVCPFCKLPELEILPEDAWLEYFAHLDILLKTLLETDVHELFQRKLRDRTLARDPNFKWCMECSSGFFVHPKQKRLRCPECRSVTCASCRKPWTSNHEGVTCEQYAAWLDDNDPERSVAAVQQHLRENGLECPRCHFKYSLSRGGCMHFTCTQCKYEFCYGCGKPFTMGARCGLSDYCAKLGLHAHHPRNCLFYLRDKEPHELQTLLQMNNVQYETAAGEGATGRCPVQLQRETPTGLVDGICGHEAPPNYAGLCKNHYVEYLTRVVRGARVEPLPLLSVEDLETLVRRAALRPPPRPYGSLDGVYRRALSEIVREKIPLD